MAVTPLIDGFQVWGNKYAVLVDVSGPSTYVPGTGQAITAQECMMSSIQYVEAAMTSDASYFLAPYGQHLGSGDETVYLLWVTASTMAEAGAIDLSSYHARLLVVGI